MQILCRLILFFCSIIFLNAPVAFSEPIRCGAVVAVTGPLAPIGISIKNAINLALKENSKASNVEFIFEDDQFQAKNTASAVRKLLNVDHVKCLVTFGSSTSLAVVDIAERAGIPTFSIAITPKVVSGRPHIFRAYVTIEKQNAAIAAEVLKRKYESVALVTTVQDATLALRDLFVESTSARVVFDQQVLPDDKDLNTLAGRIKSLNPSAVFINLLPPQISIMAKQLRNLGYKGEFFSGPPLGNPSEIAASSGMLSGAWFASLNDQNASLFYKSYQDVYGERPPLEAVYGYEIANLVVAKSLSGTLFENLKSTTSVHGLLGDYPIVSNTFDFPVGIWKVSDSSFEICGLNC